MMFLNRDRRRNENGRRLHADLNAEALEEFSREMSGLMRWLPSDDRRRLASRTKHGR